MKELFDLAKFDSYKEDNRREVKESYKSNKNIPASEKIGKAIGGYKWNYLWGSENVYFPLKFP